MNLQYKKERNTCNSLATTTGTSSMVLAYKLLGDTPAVFQDLFSLWVFVQSEKKRKGKIPRKDSLHGKNSSISRLDLIVRYSIH